MHALVSSFSKRTRRIGAIALVCAVLVVVVAFALGKGGLVSYASRSANRELEAGRISVTENWTQWAQSIVGNHYRLDLLRAACFRELGERDRWEQHIELAEQNDPSPAELKLEQQLGELRWGETNPTPVDDIPRLVFAGASPREAVTVVVQGLLSRGDVQQAKQTLRAIQDQPLSDASTSYLNGLCEWSDENLNSAIASFRHVLEQQPENELAHSHLGRLLEQQERISEASLHYEFLTEVAPERPSVRLSYARSMRKLGRLEQSKKIYPTPDVLDVAPEIALEMAERFYQAGDYAVADQWFERADMAGSHRAETLRTAASVQALLGEYEASQQLFTRVDEAQANSRHFSELRRRLEIDPNDRTAAADLQQLSQARSPAPEVEPAQRLYNAKCAACHGALGAADGRAARFLYPRPRNFRSDPMRLISTENRVASRDDLERVIASGIPGTSMPAFPDLSQSELAELMGLIERFRQQGAQEIYETRATAAGLEVDPAALEAYVATRTMPSAELAVPVVSEVLSTEFEDGAADFKEFGCAHCHGIAGEGPTDLPLFDSAGRRVTARDLAREPMKGESTAEAIFLRIRLGMPGTPHPALADVSDERVLRLVHYCLHLARTPRQLTSNHQRSQAVYSRNLNFLSRN